MASCLPFEFPKTPFDPTGLGPRLCAFLRSKVEFSTGRNGNDKVKVNTLKKWKHTLIHVVLYELRCVQKLSLDEIRDLMGMAYIDEKHRQGILPLFATIVATSPHTISSPTDRTHHSKIDVLEEEGNEGLSTDNEGQLRPFPTLAEARLHPNDVEILMQAAPSSSVQAAWKLGKKSAGIKHRMRSSSYSLVPIFLHSRSRWSPQ